jgi:hypothetical protein
MIKGTLKQLPHLKLGYPFQRLSIDLVGPFPMSPEGYTHLLTVRCTFPSGLKPFR